MYFLLHLHFFDIFQNRAQLYTQTIPEKKAMVVIFNGKSMKETGTLCRVLKELEQAVAETEVFD